HRFDALSFSAFDVLLNLLEFVRHLFVRVKLDVVAGVLIGQLFFLESAVIESRHGQFGSSAGPLGDRYIAVVGIRSHGRAGADKGIALRKAEGHLKRSAIAELPAGVVWIPGRARSQNKVATSRIAQRLAAVVLNRNLVILTSLKWLRQNDGKVS